MDTERALLAAVWANPHDDLPRLVYADWLDEHDQPARALFIRVQCELARVGWWDDRTAELQQREQQLLDEHRSGWLPRQRLKHTGTAFHRGFLSPSFDGDLRTFRSEIPLARAVAPLYDVSLTVTDGFDAFLNWPPAEGMKALRLSDRFVGWGKRLVGSPLVRNLSRLAVDDPHIPPDDFGRFCRAAHLAHLSELSVSRFETMPEAIDQIVTAPFAQQLRVLALGADRELDSARVTRLLALGSLGRLECLRLHAEYSRYSWEGFLRMLAEKPDCRGLRCLHINGGAISEAGCLTLLDWSGAATLRELVFTPSRVVPAPPVVGVRVETLIALLESDRLPRLWKLGAEPTNYDRRVSDDPGGRVAKLRQLAHDRGVRLDLW